MWLQSQAVLKRHLYIMLHGEYNTYRHNMSVYMCMLEMWGMGKM